MVKDFDTTAKKYIDKISNPKNILGKMVLRKLKKKLLDMVSVTNVAIIKTEKTRR